jgi:transposase
MGERYERLRKNESITETRRESLSLHPQPIPEIPEETVRIAQSVLPKGNVWMRMREE